MVIPIYDVEILIHPDYIVCQKCGSKDLRANEGSYDANTHIFNVDMAGCTFFSYKLFQCNKCDHYQITPTEIYNSLKYEVFNWLRAHSESDLSEFLFEKILEKESRVYKLVEGITDKKILAKLRLLLPNKYQNRILEQSNFLDTTNPLLTELELLVKRRINKLTVDKINEFGYFSNNHTILRLNLPGVKLKKLPERISLFPNLRFLSLQNNDLTHLPDKLDRLSRLEGLNLANNQFTKFPRVLTNMLSLRHISIANNPIREIPKDIENLDLKTIEIDVSQYQSNKPLMERLPKRIIQVIDII